MKIPKAVLLSLLFALAQGAGVAAKAGPRWLTVTGDKSSPPSRATVVRASDAGYEIKVTVPGVSASEIPFPGGDKYTQLDLPGCGVAAEGVGHPEMPFKGFYLEIPYGVDLSVELLDTTTISLGTGHRIYPQQAALPDCGDEEPPPFKIDRSAYARDAFVPQAPVVLDDPAFMRGRRVVFVQAFPLRYNPVTTELRAYKTLRFRLKLSGKADPGGAVRKQRLATGDSESLMGHLILNYEPAPLSPARIKRSPRAEGAAEYLIIVKDDLYEEIQPLAAWKWRKGFITHVQKISNVGSTHTAIKAYIQNAYDTWNPAPWYVLLVGDQQDIPGFDMVGHPYHGSSHHWPSDHPYACVDGGDYLPDLILGRLSVHTEEECEEVVDKIMDYDNHPFPASGFGRFLSAGYFQDSDSPWQEADRWFMETTAHVTEYLENDVGMTTNTAWCTNTSGAGSTPPYRYKSSSYPHRFTPPDPVPDWVRNAWIPAADATDKIIDQFGGGLVYHRDHGSPTGWGDPPFSVDNVKNDLRNYSRPPVVYSINCQTGWFDYGSGDCLAEALQKHDRGGAVGVIAATRVSYSGYNDLLTHGIFDSHYPDYDPSHGATSYAASPRPAEALAYGKHYMRTYEGATANHTERTFNLYHWFGDPEMMLRDREAENIWVEYLLAVSSGRLDVTIIATVRSGPNDGDPIPGARVTISHPSNSDYWTGLTNDEGSITFEDIDRSEFTTYNLAISAHNFRPRDGHFQVDYEGSCCSDETAACLIDTLPLDCLDYLYTPPVLQDGRWHEWFCSEFEPPCGQGTCCTLIECLYSTLLECLQLLLGEWLGHSADCSDCCILSCPGGATAETEACGSDTNGGCDMGNPAFEPIECPATVCGTLWADGGARDTDWYELNIASPQQITITLDAESPAVVGIKEQLAWGQPGCNNLTGWLAWHDGGDSCDELNQVTVCLPAGTYYVYVAASVDEGHPCDTDGRGNDYVLTMTCADCATQQGACCDNVTGTCTPGIDEVHCQGYGQRFAPGASCLPDPFVPSCATPWGACCDDSAGACEEGVYAGDCLPLGRFAAAPGTCYDFDPPCDYSGCCLPGAGDYTCESRTSSACLLAGGDPQGVDTVCGTARGCCMQDGSCLEVDPLCCDEMGGSVSYAEHCLGDGTGTGADDACELPSGRVPDQLDWTGIPLTVAKATASEITLNWAVSCRTTDSEYAIHEGTLGNYYSHEARYCGLEGETTKTFEPLPGNAYYLVVPGNSVREGSYGTDSNGEERPQSASHCRAQEIGNCW